MSAIPPKATAKADISCERCGRLFGVHCFKQLHRCGLLLNHWGVLKVARVDNLSGDVRYSYLRRRILLESDGNDSAVSLQSRICATREQAMADFKARLV
jgi:hypothetical protein